MATFLEGDKLNSEIGNLIENAREQIVLISPYIKLHDRYIAVLKTKAKPEVKLVIVFGKNEDDLSKSMTEVDFNFFKGFPNVEIYYEKRLHAKYIANEEASILTSMNFHKYSQDNNIEVGVMTKATLLGNLAHKIWQGEDDFETQAWRYFSRVIEQAELVFQSVPQYESGFLGITKKYTSPKICVDKLSEFFQNKNINTKENQSSNKSELTGFCIRTGKRIAFNLEQPMTKEAFESWEKFKNKNYKEKYCHFSGEESNGTTTFSRPILKQHWEKAKKAHQL